MVVGVYAVFDEKAGAFLAPFTYATDGMASRSFVNEVKRPDSLIGSSPEDFSLIKLGTFDDQTGALEGDYSTVLTGLQARSMVVNEAS